MSRYLFMWLNDWCCLSHSIIPCYLHHSIFGEHLPHFSRFLLFFFFPIEPPPSPLLSYTHTCINLPFLSSTKLLYQYWLIMESHVDQHWEMSALSYHWPVNYFPTVAQMLVAQISCSLKKLFLVVQTIVSLKKFPLVYCWNLEYSSYHFLTFY